MNLKHLPIGKLIKLRLLTGFRAVYHPIVWLPFCATAPSSLPSPQQPLSHHLLLTPASHLPGG